MPYYIRASVYVENVGAAFAYAFLSIVVVVTAVVVASSSFSPRIVSK